MALSPADIAEIDSLLGAPDASLAALTALRARFPKLSLTRADESDMVEKPYKQYERFDLYLVDGGGHCWTITQDPDIATGLVVASRRAGP